jgi:hypothetical protein
MRVCFKFVLFFVLLFVGSFFKPDVRELPNTTY